MEFLSEQNLKLLLQKEWLVKVDNDKSAPYLLKFYCSTVDLSCCILITDTMKVWGEVLSSKQFARRWQECNDVDSEIYNSAEEEDEWRTQRLALLSSAHALGVFTDLTFEVVESRNADFAFELASDSFKWRWETYSTGPRVSAEILSKHLLLPLISVTHLAFSSVESVSGLPDVDLEKAVDKIGRTARRMLDTHVKNVISKPRVATTIRRMTAMLNFLPDLPSIRSDTDKPDLFIPSSTDRSRASPKPPSSRIQLTSKDAQPSTLPKSVPLSPVPDATAPNKPIDEDSATEPEQSDDEAFLLQSRNAKAGDKDLRSPKPSSLQHTKVSSSTRTSPVPSHPPTPEILPTSRHDITVTTPDPEASSSHRPIKKAKRAPLSSSSDEDSEEERRRRVAQIKNGVRGTKQPLKRGGKRF